MRFTDAYASCPVCSPTRASILTGRYPARIGVTNWIGGNTKGKLIDAPYSDHLTLEETCLAKALNEDGYATWHVGKWHLGKEPFYPEKHGFEVNVGGCEAGSPGKGGYFSPWTIPVLQDADVPDGTLLTDYLTDRAIDLLKNRDDRPFYLHFCFYAPHTPIQAKQEKIEKYEDRVLELGLDKVETFEEGNFFPCEHKKEMRIKRRLVQSDPVYASMIESVDENIGRLLATLEEEGLTDDTVVFFTSDNGGLATSEGSPTCNSPLSEGKGWMYEGGTRDPLMIRWPKKIREGSVCDVPVTSPDYYPTILEMAGLDPRPGQHCDGVSLMPVLLETGELDREAIFWHYPHYGNQGGTPGASVRSGDYKLIEFFEDGKIELYNLREDIGEEHNLAKQESGVASGLKSMLDKWKENVGAITPITNPEFEPWQD